MTDQEKPSNKYIYTEDCDEIGGLGDEYENACRKMVISGMEWLQKNKDIEINFSTMKGVFGPVFGFILPESKSAINLTDHMSASVGNDCTGAMMHMAVNHVLFAKENGWDKYIEILEERKRHKND